MSWFKKDEIEGMSLGEITELLGWLRTPTSMVFTPTNLEEEKEKFFASSTYNPQFKYNIVKNKNASLLKTLTQVKQVFDVDPIISEFYIKLIASKDQANDLMYAAGDNEKLTEISIARFGFPSQKLFNNATRVLRGNYDRYNVISHKDSYRGDWIDYDGIKRAFEIAFEELGLLEWSVGTSKNIKKNGLKVGLKSYEVFMSEDIRRKPMKLRKTLVHELTHILRSQNGLATGYEALGGPTLPSYLDAEEGFAAWNEETFGLMTEKDLRNRAAKTVAIYLGKTLNFRELYNTMLAVVPKGLAWSFAYSAKKGLSDTSKPGVNTRDVAYFRGFRRVRRRFADDKSLVEKMYAGKINFKQIKWLDDGIIRKPKFVLEKKTMEKVFKKAGI
jgi:hypothetical protein